MESQNLPESRKDAQATRMDEIHAAAEVLKSAHTEIVSDGNTTFVIFSKPENS